MIFAFPGNSKEHPLHPFWLGKRPSDERSFASLTILVEISNLVPRHTMFGVSWRLFNPFTRVDPTIPSTTRSTLDRVVHSLTSPFYLVVYVGFPVRRPPPPLPLSNDCSLLLPRCIPEPLSRANRNKPIENTIQYSTMTTVPVRLRRLGFVTTRIPLHRPRHDTITIHTFNILVAIYFLLYTILLVLHRRSPPPPPPLPFPPLTQN